MAEEDKKVRWYHQTYSIVMGFLIAGPFVLPLVWTHPRLSRKAKIFWSIVMVFFTVLLTVGLGWCIKQIKDYYQLIFQAQN